jgi:hypothetical protein
MTHAFDPATWLAQFETVGGGYTITENLNLFIRVLGNSYANMALGQRMIAALAAEQNDALQAHLLALHAAKLGEA